MLHQTRTVDRAFDRAGSRYRFNHEVQESEVVAINVGTQHRLRILRYPAKRKENRQRWKIRRGFDEVKSISFF